MKNRYVVLFEGQTKEKDELFIKELQKIDASWWHWIEGSWLIVDSQEKTNVTEISNLVYEIYSDSCLVMDMKTHRWHGYGYKGETMDFFEWLNDVWSK